MPLTLALHLVSASVHDLQCLLCMASETFHTPVLNQQYVENKHSGKRITPFVTSIVKKIRFA